MSDYGFSVCLFDTDEFRNGWEGGRVRLHFGRVAVQPSVLWLFFLSSFLFLSFSFVIISSPSSFLRLISFFFSYLLPRLTGSWNESDTANGNYSSRCYIVYFATEPMFDDKKNGHYFFLPFFMWRCGLMQKQTQKSRHTHLKAFLFGNRTFTHFWLVILTGFKKKSYWVSFSVKLTFKKQCQHRCMNNWFPNRPPVFPILLDIFIAFLRLNMLRLSG